MKDPRDVIVRPVVSEKSYALLEDNVYTFEVHPSASRSRVLPRIHASGRAVLSRTARTVGTLPLWK